MKTRIWNGNLSFVIDFPIWISAVFDNWQYTWWITSRKLVAQHVELNHSYRKQTANIKDSVTHILFHVYAYTINHSNIAGLTLDIPSIAHEDDLKTTCQIKRPECRNRLSPPPLKNTRNWKNSGSELDWCKLRTDSNNVTNFLHTHVNEDSTLNP